MRINNIYYKLSFFLPIILLIIGINYFVDPANIFQYNYELGIARIMLSGENVADIGNCDERIVQKDYIQNLEKKKDIILLGSSRSLQIRANFFAGKSFFNSSVSGATIEDFMAIYELYRSNDIVPKTIILGLEPWLLNKNNYQNSWQSLGDYYNRILERISIKNDGNSSKIYKLNRYTQIFSPVYFQSSSGKLVEIIKTGKKYYYSTDQENLAVREKLSDGSLVYDEETRNITPEEVLKLVDLYKKSKPIYLLDKFSELDKQEINKLEAYINILKKDGVEIVFFLPPYHPLVYDYMMNTKDNKMVKEAQIYYENLARKENIKLIGSFDPSTFPNNYEGFYDGMHPRSEFLREIFKTYY